MHALPSPVLISIAACASATLLLLDLPAASAYRIQGSEDENKPFVPYERGFVQNPSSTGNHTRTRANQGYENSASLGDAVGKNRLHSCPGMVGPVDDGEYHCRGPEYGYCDRRSGTCFCEEGYAGESCEECASTHFEIGGLCSAKRVCPNDCSYAGQCDYRAGTCECDDHREGDDCSRSKCSTFHQFCTHCNDDGCIECEDGFSVHGDSENGSQCEPCWRFDPRCRQCDEHECTSCIDLLLLSIHRSGRRPQDPPLPYDELTRELSVTVPFGSRQADAFYDAEHYFLVDPALVPLNESAVECHQGLNFDDSIACVPYNLTSHIVCGNHGTIIFESPEYAVREDGKQIRLTLQRTGGGVGEATVSYSIYPITAGYEDVTSTAFYTANQTVVFRPGQIRASFLVTINDDRLMEENETFSVHLSNPTGLARLGTQSRTIVTIIDDDEQRTCSDKTTLGIGSRDLGSVEAGNAHRLNVFAKTCRGIRQTIGGDVIGVEARRVSAENVPQGFDAPITKGKCHDLDDGTYACDVNVTIRGNYELDVYQLVPGGLKGHYYTDNYLSAERLDLVRTDAVVNFTWGTGAVTTFGRDFVSVRWEGYVRPSFSETYTFWIDVDDHARLWIDGNLLIDSWIFSPTTGMLHAKHDLAALENHELVLEYRDTLGNATARLLWSSASEPLTAIPSAALFYKEPIQNNPFFLQVLSAYPSAEKTTAFGRGLYQGIAGKVHPFTVEPKDRFGNFRGWPLNESIPDDTRHLDKFHATAELNDDDGSGPGNSLIPVIMSYNKYTRRFDASWNPKRAGIYMLNVTLPNTQGARHENHVFGSPFIVNTSPGATFAPESIAFGGYGHCLPWIVTSCSGIFHGMAGKNSTFIIQAVDINRNKRNIGGDSWKVVVSGKTNSDYHIGSIKDFKNGTYEATVAPLTSGRNDLFITLDNSAIKGSPFTMEVVHDQVTGSSSYAVDEEDVNSMTAMTENMILVQANDEWGNKAIYCNEHPFSTSVSVQSEGIDSSKTRVSYAGGGKYEVIVTPVKSGPIHLSIRLNDSDLKGSPFDIDVHPGTFSSSSSSASGAGLSRANAGIESTFTIQAKDEGGNKKVEDEALFDVYLILVERPAAPTNLHFLGFEEESAVVTGALEFKGNGQYGVKYTCYVSGEYMMRVRDSEGEDITGSPFQVTIVPAMMSAPHSLVTGQGLIDGVAGEVAEVRVYGRDEYGNFVSAAVETIEMTLSLKSRHQSDWEITDPNVSVGSHKSKQLARDSGGGIFVLDYKPAHSGNYDLGLTTFSPGGLEGSYYSTLDMSPDHLISTSMDEVEKYWENDSHFSVVWNGKLKGDHDEQYTIGVECDDGGHASLAIDGSYVPWQTCYPIMTTSVTMNANKPIHFSLRYKTLDGSDGSAFVILKWASPSVPMERVPSRNLYHKVNFGNATLHHPVIVPQNAYSPSSLAVGDSLRYAIAGVEHEFTVESRDAYGNLLLDGGLSVQVDSFNYEGDGQLETIIIDNKNGTYNVKYTPVAAGIYFLSVSIGGSGIKESPFLLRVDPGETDPENCMLLVNGSIEGVTGRETQLQMQAMDASNNKRHVGGDKIFATMTHVNFGGPEERLHCKADYVTHGLYSVTCAAASHSGSYLLNIDILTSMGDTKTIKASPFQVIIYAGHATPRTTEVTLASPASNSQVDPNVVIFTSKAGLYETFKVSAKDRFGNPLNTGGNQFVARVHGDTNIDPSEKRIEVIDQGNGSYVFAYRVSQPSTYSIDVDMVTGGLGLVGEYYTNETSFKEGRPHELVVDEQINFNIRRLSNDRLISYFRWIGYLSFPHTSVFDFAITGIEGSCKLVVGNTLILDTAEESASGSFRAIENVLYEIKIEYALDINRLVLQLFWSSRKMGRQIVPKSHFFSSTEPIHGSPFPLTVNE